MKIDRISISKFEKDEMLASVTIHLNEIIIRGVKIFLNKQGECDVRFPTCINSIAPYRYIDFYNFIDEINLKEQILNYYNELKDTEIDFKNFYPNYNNMENIEDLLSDLEVLNNNEISINIINKIRESLNIN